MPTVDTRLAGIRVLVTRPASQASGLSDMIRAAGGEPVLFPTLAIEPVAPDVGEIERLAACDTVIFVSANAAVHGYPVLRDLDGPGTRRVLAVGHATRQVLADMGCRNVAAPPAGQRSSEGLLASPGLQDVADRAICIVRGQGGRDVLKRELVARGARVSYLECYRRRLPRSPDTAVLTRALGDQHDRLVVSATSVTGLINLLVLAPDASRPRLIGRPLVVIGSRQRAAAREQGWTGPVLEAGAGDAEIVAEIAAWRHRNSVPRH